jgi:hypothetical protein
VFNVLERPAAIGSCIQHRLQSDRSNMRKAILAIAPAQAFVARCEKVSVNAPPLFLRGS